MMPETPLPIDPEERPFRIALRAAIVIVPLLLFFVWAGSTILERRPIRNGDVVEAKVVGLQPGASERTPRPFLRAILEDEKEVLVRARPEITVRVGDRVLLREVVDDSDAIRRYRLESRK
jgi:hypothetical protein